MAAVDDTDVEPELVLDRTLDPTADAGGVAITAEDDVPALEIRLDVLAAEGRVQRAQPGHRDEVVAADVDPAQQRDTPLGHRLTVALDRWSLDTDLQPAEVLPCESQSCHNPATMTSAVLTCACPCRPTAMQGGWCIEACDTR